MKKDDIIIETLSVIAFLTIALASCSPKKQQPNNPEIGMVETTPTLETTEGIDTMVTVTPNVTEYINNTPSPEITEKPIVTSSPVITETPLEDWYIQGSNVYDNNVYRVNLDLLLNQKFNVEELNDDQKKVIDEIKDYFKDIPLYCYYNSYINKIDGHILLDTLNSENNFETALNMYFDGNSFFAKYTRTDNPNYPKTECCYHFFSDNDISKSKTIKYSIDDVSYEIKTLTASSIITVQTLRFSKIVDTNLSIGLMKSEYLSSNVYLLYINNYNVILSKDEYDMLDMIIKDCVNSGDLEIFVSKNKDLLLKFIDSDNTDLKNIIESYSNDFTKSLKHN